MSFKEKKYTIKKEAISKEMARFLYEYVSLKRKVARTMFDVKYLSPYTEYFGVWNDQQVPETYSHYSDIVMETLLEDLRSLMEKETGLVLLPTYSYFRIYKKGDILKKHKDRAACSVSTTMNLGGDPWPIFINPNQNEGVYKDQDYVPSNGSGVKVELEPGDMLIYSGCDLEHWREPFEGNNNAQVFLHYNNKSEPNARAEKFDRRIHLGLPAWFKGKIVQDFK
tara:strand:- start:307 stop:978 length:672 start_codon:yes stop_codon:yes gene_type:complete